MELFSNPYFLFILSTYLIFRASSVFDLAASYLARNLKPGIKGPTINAVASSLPELIISCIFLFKFQDMKGFSAGYATIVGSSIFNIAIIPTIAFLVIFFQGKHKTFITYKKIILQDGLFLVFAEVLLLVSLYAYGVSRIMALTLMGVYIIYVIYIYRSRMKGSEEKEVVKENFAIEQRGWLKDILLLNFFSFFNKSGKINRVSAIIVVIISVGIIGWACNSLVFACETFANDFGISLFIVSFVVAAIASSFPDTLLSIKDAQKGKFMDSFSNAYGSNIFDICICIGLPVFLFLVTTNNDLIPPLSSDLMTYPNYKFDQGQILLLIIPSALFLVGFTILISMIYYFNNIKLWNAIFIISLYGFFIWLIVWYSNHPENIDVFLQL